MNAIDNRPRIISNKKRINNEDKKNTPGSSGAIVIPTSVTSSDHQATGMADQNNRKPIWKVKVTNSCDLTPLR